MLRSPMSISRPSAGGAMMVVGVGYRILPMILPAAMPQGFWVYASAVLLECGIAGLVWGFLAGGRGLSVSALLLVAGSVASFRASSGCSATESPRLPNFAAPTGAWRTLFSRWGI